VFGAAWYWRRVDDAAWSRTVQSWGFHATAQANDVTRVSPFFVWWSLGTRSGREEVGIGLQVETAFASKVGYLRVLNGVVSVHSLMHSP
jgi:hypothetical protein